jgi:hypothetical protein
MHQRVATSAQTPGGSHFSIFPQQAARCRHSDSRAHQFRQACHAPSVSSNPIRPTNSLIGQLIVDPDDLNMDLVKGISDRTGRSLEDAASNPYYGHVRTVADLVHFFNAQPHAMR